MRVPSRERTPREQGQSLIEYIMLVALVAVALIFSTQELGIAFSDLFRSTADSMASTDVFR